jgi:hypothetical protein
MLSSICDNFILPDNVCLNSEQINNANKIAPITQAINKKFVQTKDRYSIAVAVKKQYIIVETNVMLNIASEFKPKILKFLCLCFNNIEYKVITTRQI